MTKLENMKFLSAPLGISRSYCYRLVNKGTLLPPLVVRVGNSYRVNPAELEAWMRTGGHYETDSEGRDRD